MPGNRGPGLDFSDLTAENYSGKPCKTDYYLVYDKTCSVSPVLIAGYWKLWIADGQHCVHIEQYGFLIKEYQNGNKTGPDNRYIQTDQHYSPLFPERGTDFSMAGAKGPGYGV